MTREQLLEFSKDDETTIVKNYDEYNKFDEYHWSFGYSSGMNYLFNTMSEKEVMYSLNKFNKLHIQYRKNMPFKLLEFIMFFHGLPSYWWWYGYSKSSGVRMDDVKKTEEMFQYLRQERLEGKNMKSDEFEHIRNAEYHSLHRRWNWNYKGLSENPNLTIDYIRYYMLWQKKWNLKETAMWNGRVQDSQTEWDWEKISKNSAFITDHIECNSDLPWNYRFVSANPTIRMQFVLDHPDKDWDWNELSRNVGITMDDINSYPELSWNFEYVSVNPNIKMEFIRRNRDKIHFGMLSENLLTRIKEDPKKEIVAERKRKADEAYRMIYD